MQPRCQHLRKAFFRLIASNGAVHVVEKCLDCGDNPRSGGVFVKHSEVASRIEDLPLLADHRGDENAPRQADLFGEE